MAETEQQAVGPKTGEEQPPHVKLVQVRVPDRSDPDLRERVRRESLAIEASEQEREITDWVEQASDYSGWEA
jgi:Protein  of unknown function (DUF3018)